MLCQHIFNSSHPLLLSVRPNRSVADHPPQSAANLCPMLRSVANSVSCRMGFAWPARGLASAFATATEDGAAAGAERARIINKLLYRSRQRGFLELDLLVGLWAEHEVPKMDTHMLQQFTVVLDQENPDLFKWLTGQQEPPNEMQSNSAFKALQQHVAQQLSNSCHTASQAAPGKEWLRGWDDSWRSSGKGQQEAPQQTQGS